MFCALHARDSRRPVWPGASDEDPEGLRLCDRCTPIGGDDCTSRVQMPKLTPDQQKGRHRELPMSLTRATHSSAGTAGSA